MRLDAPVPSISGLFSSWLALSGWLCRACIARVQTFTVTREESIENALLDLGCPPRPVVVDADDLPTLNPDAFLATVRAQAESTVREAVAVINSESHVCLAAITREQVHALFRELADVVLARAIEQRIEWAESARGETDSTAWVKRFRRMMAEEGRWPPPPAASEGDKDGEEAVNDGSHATTPGTPHDSLP